MVDIKLNQYFDVIPNSGGDLPTVDGFDQFEQTFAHYLTAYYYSEIGEVNTANVKKRIQVIAERYVSRSDYADDVAYIEPYFPDHSPGTLRVRMAYVVNREAFDRNISNPQEDG